SKSKGGFVLLYEEAKGAAQMIDLKTYVPIGKTFTYKMDLSGGKLKVFINGTQVYSRTPSARIQAKKFYFKFGNYDQASTKGTPTTTPFSRVEFYSAVVSHK
ncbi:MAG TPA: polysaccharide lyase family 7 protein, partial [Polyangiaceae bacterium]|nr:polysaccharide lyase family 7 protein [Polyangiaceae bacterium]